MIINFLYSSLFSLLLNFPDFKSIFKFLALNQMLRLFRRQQKPVYPKAFQNSTVSHLLNINLTFEGKKSAT